MIAASISTDRPGEQHAAAMALPHGGDLDRARQLFADAPQPWVDLSTGINPWPYPVPPLAPDAWTRLPGTNALSGLLDAARHRYAVGVAGSVTAAPGTQAILQTLPLLRARSRVAVLSPTYGEHAHVWRTAGHMVAEVPDLEPLLDHVDVAILVNPNNPDGRRHDPDRLGTWAGRLAARGGWLIVDEAFADMVPADSAGPLVGRPGLLVLRSFGKFYGLAGVRLGFLLADAAVATAAAQRLGPWAVSGPALSIGQQALMDTDWTLATSARLARAATDLDQDLTAAGLTLVGGTSLFRLARGDNAAAAADHLARAGLWVRRFAFRPDWLRFGLPPTAAARQRLQSALMAKDRCP